MKESIILEAVIRTTEYPAELRCSILPKSWDAASQIGTMRVQRALGTIKHNHFAVIDRFITANILWR